MSLCAEFQCEELCESFYRINTEKVELLGIFSFSKYCQLALLEAIIICSTSYV